MASQSNDLPPVNVRFWNALAGAHGRGGDSYYDLDALVAGRSSMSDVEEAAVRESVGDVNGLDLLQVGVAHASGTLCRQRARSGRGCFSAPVRAADRADAPLPCHPPTRTATSLFPATKRRECAVAARHFRGRMFWVQPKHIVFCPMRS
jgi:hypothetical protein